MEFFFINFTISFIIFLFSLISIIFSSISSISWTILTAKASHFELIIFYVKQSKPKKKVKKIVYESDSEEEVIVRKKKPPLEKLVYDNTKDQLYHRMIEERVKITIIGYGNSLGV